nr:rifin PIR protein,putative [Plasmodium sp. DRC-Itaito]
MKLYCCKILLFALPLNILITSSSNVGSQLNNPSITTHHTPIYTSRVLSERGTQSSNYNNDEDMKSVKKRFDDRTSQRFQEYEEHKREKSLAEKVEKGCLRCGCALGGGVLPVWGLVSGLWYATLSHYVSTTLVKEATDAGIKAGLKVGLAKVREIANPTLSGLRGTMPTINELETLTTGISGDNVTLHGIIKCISSNINAQLETSRHQIFFQTVNTMALKTPTEFNRGNNLQAATEVTKAIAKAEEGILTKGVNATSILTTGITASIVAIVVIVLVMVIIYLVLRYRRKKKMKKKAQYTKLLNQ